MNNKTITNKVLVGSSCAIVLLLGTKLWAQDDEEAPPPPPAQSNPVMTHVASGNEETQISNDGSMSYSYPILVPPGRGAVTPVVGVRYSSSNRKNGVLGVGFQLRMPAIELSTKFGRDDARNLYMANGEELTLRPDWNSSLGYGFGARIEENFTRYYYKNNSWTAVTRDGVRYYYGRFSTSREDRKWYLDKVQDPQGNVTAYNYTRNPYSAQHETNRLYLDNIVYTLTTRPGPKAPYLVKFRYIPSGDPSVSYMTGMAVRNSYLLSRILVYADPNPGGTMIPGCSEYRDCSHLDGFLVRSYDFSYRTDSLIDTGKMSFLSSIVAKEDQGVFRSTTEFTWNNSDANASSGDPFFADEEFMEPYKPGYKTIPFDYNGDNIQDMLVFYRSSYLSHDRVQSGSPDITVPAEEETDYIISIRKGEGDGTFTEVYREDVNTICVSGTFCFRLCWDSPDVVGVVSFDFNGDNRDDLIFWSTDLSENHNSDKMLIFGSKPDGPASGNPFTVIHDGGSLIDEKLTFDKSTITSTMKYELIAGNGVPVGGMDWGVSESKAHDKVTKTVSTTAVIPIDVTGDGKQELLIFNGYGEDWDESEDELRGYYPYQDQNCQAYLELANPTLHQEQRSITLIRHNESSGLFETFGDRDILTRSVDKNPDNPSLGEWWENMRFYRDEIQVMDFNGDGYQDIALMKIPTAGHTGVIPDETRLYIFQSNGTGGFLPANEHPDGIALKFDTSDVIPCAHHVYSTEEHDENANEQNDGAGMPSPPDPDSDSSSPISMKPSGARRFVSGSSLTVFDYNGDGYSDILVGSPFFNRYSRTREYDLFRSDGEGFHQVGHRFTDVDGFGFQTVSWDEGSGVSGVTPVDYNYDGLTDLAFKTGDLAVSVGNGFESATMKGLDEWSVDVSYGGLIPGNFDRRGALQFYAPINHFWYSDPNYEHRTESKHAIIESRYEQIPHLLSSIKTLYGNQGNWSECVGNPDELISNCEDSDCSDSSRVPMVPCEDGTGPFHKSIEITYEASSFDRVHTNLPFVMPVTKSIKVLHGTDVERDPSVTEYSYAGGNYDVKDREFRGFATVVKTLPDSTVIRETYETTDYYTKGKLLQRVTSKKLNAANDGDDRGHTIQDYSWVGTIIDSTEELVIPDKRAAFVRLKASNGCWKECVQVNDEDCTTYCEDGISVGPDPTVPEVKEYAIRTEVRDRASDGTIHTRVVGVNFTYNGANGLKMSETKTDLGNDTWVVTEWNHQNFDSQSQNWKVISEETRGSDSDGKKENGPARKTTYEYYTSHTERGLPKYQRVFYGDGNYEYAETYFTYSPWGNVKTVTDALGRTTSYEYDSLTQTYRIKTTSPSTTSPHSQTPVPHVVELRNIDYKYGKALTEIDENGNEMETELDALGRVKRVVQPNFNGGNVAILYDYNDHLFPRNTLVRVPTNYENSELKYLRTRTYIDGSGNPLQVVTRGEKKDGKQTYLNVINKYDLMGRIRLAQGPYLSEAEAYYFQDCDTSGNHCVGEEIPNWKKTGYDYAGRVIWVEQSNDGLPIRAETEYLGFVQRVTDPDGNVTETEEDGFGRILRVTESNRDCRSEGECSETGHHNTIYKYFASGDLRSILSYNDQKGQWEAIGYEYDLRGLKTLMVDPDMGARVYHYNLDGTLYSMTDAIGNNIWYEYDELGRVVEKTAIPHWGTDTYSLHFAYDTCHDDSENNHLSGWQEKNCVGRLFSSQSDFGSPCSGEQGANECTQNARPEEAYTRVNRYNELGLVMSQTKRIDGATNSQGVPEEFTTKMAYDYAGKPIELTYPDGHVVETTYHPGTTLVHEVREKGSSVSYAVLKNYEANGKIGDQYHGYYDDDEFATKTEYIYVPETGRLENLRTTRRFGETLQEKTYTYTKAGDISEIQDPMLDQTYKYTYDGLHRLIKEERTNPASSGTMQSSGLVYHYNGTTSHGVSTMNGVNSGAWAGLYYDENGNLIYQDEYKGTGGIVDIKRIFYNAENMPRYVDTIQRNGYTYAIEGLVFTEFVYDADGKRVAKHSEDVMNNVSESVFYVSDLYEVRETDYSWGSKSERSKYIFAGNLRIAKISDGETTSGPYNKFHYLHKDHLGSTTVVTDTGGMETEDLPTQYRPYGTPREGSKITDVTDYNFTDQEFDRSTGLYNYDARLYNPEIGLFVTADSMLPDVYDPQQLNRYAYVRNNPLIYTDPSGHQKVNVAEDLKEDIQPENPVSADDTEELEECAEIVEHAKEVNQPLTEEHQENVKKLVIVTVGPAAVESGLVAGGALSTSPAVAKTASAVTATAGAVKDKVQRVGELAQKSIEQQGPRVVAGVANAVTKATALTQKIVNSPVGRAVTKQAANFTEGVRGGVESAVTGSTAVEPKTFFGKVGYIVGAFMGSN